MADVDAVIDAARDLRIEPRRERWAHVSLCVLDAVFSIGARYSGTVRTCRRYADWAGLVPLDRAEDVAAGTEQSLAAFVAEISHYGPESFAGEVLRNRQRTSARGGIRKADAALQYAQRLVSAGVWRREDLPSLFADQARVDDLEAELRQVPGNGSSDVRLGYLWMLLGDDDLIKPDRMVLGWLDGVLGHRPSVTEARSLVTEAAHAVGCTPWELDHAVWRAQRAKPRAVVSSDGAVRRRHRAQQGRWREEVLELPAGRSENPRVVEPVESMLPEEHLGVRAEDAGWNLMSEAAIRYAHERIPVVEAANGVVARDRLFRNLLSSQPLAFSLVGELRAHPAAALRVLGELSGSDLIDFDRVGEVGDPFALEGLQAEWAPDPAQHLRDKSAFDIAALTRTTGGRRLLVTVEVKYTDDFSRAPLDLVRYADALVTADVGRDAAAELVSGGHSQFLRSVLLTASVQRAGLADEVLAVVLSRDDDESAQETVRAVGAAVPGLPTAWWGLGRFLDVAERDDELADWADAMAARYVPDVDVTR